MKTNILILTALLFLIGFTTACKEDGNGGGNPIIDDLPKIIAAVQVDALSSNYLDTIFSSTNQLIPNSVDIDKIYIINSEEELNAMNSFGFQANIDFSKYTLVGGKVVTSSGSAWIQEILLEEREKDYLLSIAVKYPSPATADDDNKYFWRLYPKLANKNMLMEVKNEEIEPTLEEKLLGEWYKVGSTENMGVRVIFTKEENITAFYYLKDYPNPDPDLDTLYNDTFYFYDNAKFNIIFDDTIKFQHYPLCPEIIGHTVAFTFKSKDTLWIDNFEADNASTVYPPIISPILLYRSK